MQCFTAITTQTDNNASTPPFSFLQAGCPSCHQTSSIKALFDISAVNFFFVLLHCWLVNSKGIIFQIPISKVFVLKTQPNLEHLWKSQLNKKPS